MLFFHLRLGLIENISLQKAKFGTNIYEQKTMDIQADFFFVKPMSALCVYWKSFYRSLPSDFWGWENLFL
jgi:hypothetical protein